MTRWMNEWRYTKYKPTSNFSLLGPVAQSAVGNARSGWMVTVRNRTFDKRHFMTINLTNSK